MSRPQGHSHVTNRSGLARTSQYVYILRAVLSFTDQIIHSIQSVLFTSSEHYLNVIQLENLLMELNCPCNLKFHNAGNDANFTLRALLLLGIKAIGTAENSETSERVKILWWIAMEGVLSQKKKKCIRRKAAKIRTLEEQEEIRVKRRQHRELYG